MRDPVVHLLYTLRSVYSSFCHFDGCIMTQFFLRSWMSFVMNIICIFQLQMSYSLLFLAVAIFFFIFYSCIDSIWKVLGQGWNCSCSWGLSHSHSSTGSKKHLSPMLQLMAMQYPEPTEQGHGLNLHPHRGNTGSLTH